MKRVLSLSLLFSLLLAASFTAPAFAAAPTPLPNITAVVPLNGNPADQISLSKLGLSRPLVLEGPFSSDLFEFYLPASWKLNAGSGQLQLSITSYFSNLVPIQGGEIVQGVIAGTLSVSLNGTTLGSFPLQNTGSEVLTMPVPESALLPDPSTGNHALTIKWDASPSCDSNLATRVSINSDTQFDLPHTELSEIPLSLAAFPRPFYALHSPDAAPLVVIVPPQPTRAELQAALSVAAGMGRISEGQLPVSLQTENQTDAGLLKQANVILIKKQTNLSGPDGRISLQVSPWNPARVEMTISGAQDAAVLAAADALNNGFVIPSSDPNLAIVQLQKTIPTVQPYQEDKPLSSLAPRDIYFDQPGSTRQQMTFMLPAGMGVGADAYLDLDLNHSQLIDYLRSGLTVRINDVPIASLRLSDSSAAGGIVRLAIPPPAFHSGVNVLEMQADIIPRNVCINPEKGGLWMHVLGDSVLHLPTESLSVPVAAQTISLGDYPQTLSSNLAELRVVLPANDPVIWNTALQLAADLGAASGQPGSPQLAFASDAPDVIFDGKSLLILGTPAQLPFLNQLNPSLPVAMTADAAYSPNVPNGAVFRIDQQKSLGYLELTGLPSIPGSVILSVWGNTNQGVAAAANALLAPDSQKRLSGGNFGIVQGAQLWARQIPAPIAAPLPSFNPAPQPSTTLAAPTETAPSALSHGLDWIFPVLVLSIVFVLSLLAFEIYNLLRKNP